MKKLKELVKIDCYLEEYQNIENKLSVRLRDKNTDKKVIITGKTINKEDFLSFLSQARINQNIMPTIYEKMVMI